MAVDLRRQIFELRERGVSQRGIATQLGISSSKVQRELSKRAPEVQAEQQVENGWAPAVDLEIPPASHPVAAASGDPLLAEERRRLELEQLELRRTQLRAQRLEAERRAQLLEHPESSQGNGVIALVLQAIDRQRDDTRTLLQQLVQRQAPPPAPAPPSLTEQLTQWRSMAETIQSFAPPKPPSSATELDFTVAKEKLLQESQDIAARREAELAIKREEAQSLVKRNEAVATAIEQFAPVAAKFVEMWFEERAEKAKHPQLPPPGGGDQPAPRPTLVQNQQNGAALEIEGECPSCRTALAIAGEGEERCPKCGATLLAAQGRIRVRMSDGNLWPPLQA